MSLTGSHSMTFGRAIAAVAVALVCASCGPVDPKNPPAKYTIQGSVSSVMTLLFDEVRITATEEDVSLLFVRARPLGATLLDGGQDTSGTSEDYPMKISYRLLGTAFPPKGRVDLAELISESEGPRGIASRNVLNDPKRAFPPIRRGTLYVDRSIASNSSVNGDFNVTFADGTDVASGRTAFASFTAKVVNQ